MTLVYILIAIVLGGLVLKFIKTALKYVLLVVLAYALYKVALANNLLGMAGINLAVLAICN